MLEDSHLLRSYVLEGSEAAFTELVNRHANLVYSVALRKVGDPSLAQDLTQEVFCDLARKARWISSRVVLAGWLHRATWYAAGQALRSKRRRQIREQEAVEVSLVNPSSSPEWIAIKPELDDALNELARGDREALLLRFFEQRSLAEIGSVVGISEDAARKRVDRAVDRLRHLLGGRGIQTTTAALAAVLLVNAVEAAPAELAVSLAGASLATVGTKTTLTFIAMSKLKLTLAGALIVVGAATPIFVQHQTNLRLRDENLRLQQRGEVVARENERLAQLGTAAEELERLRAEHAELLRLRGELGVLRREQQASNARKPLSSQPATAGQPATPVAGETYWTADSWKNAGTETADATLKTILWSAKSGDPAFTKSLIYWDGEVDPDHLADWENSVSNTVQSYSEIVSNYQGVRLVSQTEIQPDTISLHFEGVASDGSIIPNDLTFRKTGNGWRQVVSTR